MGPVGTSLVSTCGAWDSETARNSRRDRRCDRRWMVLVLPSPLVFLLLCGSLVLAAEECRDATVCASSEARVRCFSGSEVHSVPRLVGDADGWVSEAVAAGTPAIYTGTATATWPATLQWSPEYLASEVSGKLDARTIEGELDGLRVFTIRSDSRSGETLRVPGEVESGIVYRNLTARELLFGDSSDRQGYWSGPLETLGATLAAQVQPRSHLELVDERVRGDTGISQSHVRAEAVVWIGRRGTVAQTHHDRSLNFFSQIVGRKRFILYPPSAHWNLNLYPVTHPSRRQSKFGVPGTGAQQGSPASPPPCWVADLIPGDVLFVPPFWSHTVESVDDAASLSVVTPSIQEYLFSRIYWRPLPLKPLDTPASRASGVLVLIRALLEALLPRLGLGAGTGAVSTFVEQLRSSRYDSLQPSLPAGDQLRLLSSEEENDIRTTWLDEKAADFANGAASVVDDDGLREYPKETEILLCDFVEELARFAVGAQQVPQLLSELERRLSR